MSNLKEFRIKAGLTRNQLADDCEMSLSTITKLENDYDNPTLSSARTIVMVLKNHGAFRGAKKLGYKGTALDMVFPIGEAE